MLYLMTYTLRHRITKPTKWLVQPAKTQISLGIRPVWSASSLCEGQNIYWRGQRRLWSECQYYKTNKMTCAPSEVSDQPGHPPSLISVFAVWRSKNLLLRTAKTLIRLRAWQNQQNDLCTQRSLRSAWPSAQSDQRFRCVKDQTFIDADSVDSDQTERLLRLTRVFAGRTCSIVGFVMWRLIFVLISPKPQHILSHIW